jgi:hypothetical protein
LPNLSTVAADPATEWTRVTLPQWYGKAERVVEIVTSTALWYSSGEPVVPVRWVLIRDPEGHFETQALPRLFCVPIWRLLPSG